MGDSGEGHLSALGGCRTVKGTVGFNRANIPTGASAGGILVALGQYVLRGNLPRDVDMESDSGFPKVYPAVAPQTTELADRHALFLDLFTLEPKRMTRIEKYNINTLTVANWIAKHTALSDNRRFLTLADRGEKARNSQG